MSVRRLVLGACLVMVSAGLGGVPAGAADPQVQIVSPTEEQEFAKGYTGPVVVRFTDAPAGEYLLYLDGPPYGAVQTIDHPGGSAEVSVAIPERTRPHTNCIHLQLDGETVAARCFEITPVHENFTSHGTGRLARRMDCRKFRRMPPHKVASLPAEWDVYGSGSCRLRKDRPRIVIMTFRSIEGARTHRQDVYERLFPRCDEQTWWEASGRGLYIHGVTWKFREVAGAYRRLEVDNIALGGIACGP